MTFRGNFMDLASHYIKASDEVIVKEMSSKTVLLNVEQGTYYSLNKTGTLIWSCSDKNKTISDIADEMVRCFSVTRENALADTLALAQELAQEGLIEVVENPA